MTLTLITALIGGLGILVAMATVSLIARSIRRPLRALVWATKRIAAGDFAVALPERASHDEIGALTRAFATMQHLPPLRLAKNGLVTELARYPKLVLGAQDAIEYRGERLTLAEGERLFLFADGVTEACNAEGALYSE